MTVTVQEMADVVRRQMAAIDQLKAENAQLKNELAALVAWAQCDDDALMVLQKTYSNPNASEDRKLKAATAALPYERAKPAAQSVGVVVSLVEHVRTIRLAQEAKDRARWAAEDAGKLIEHRPSTILGQEPGDPAA